MSISATAHAYAKMRHALAPLGPRLSRFRALRRVVRRLDGAVLPEGEQCIDTTAGWPMWVNPGDQAVARTLIATGEWQPVETSLIVARLVPGGVAVDVGANIGWITGQKAATVGPTGRG